MFKMGILLDEKMGWATLLYSISGRLSLIRYTFRSVCKKITTEP